MNFQKTYDELPPIAKGIVVIGGGVAIAVIVVSIIRAIHKTSAEKAAAALAKDTVTETNANIASGLKATYPDSQYSAFANEIYDGMKYCVGDNYGAVRDTLMKMQNNLDVNKLVTAYGSRQLYCFGIPSGDPKDLFTAVKSELGSEYFGFTSSKLDAVNADWAKKGIKYNF